MLGHIVHTVSPLESPLIVSTVRPQCLPGKLRELTWDPRTTVTLAMANLIFVFYVTGGWCYFPWSRRTIQSFIWSWIGGAYMATRLLPLTGTTFLGLGIRAAWSRALLRNLSNLTKYISSTISLYIFDDIHIHKATHEIMTLSCDSSLLAIFQYNFYSFLNIFVHTDVRLSQPPPHSQPHAPWSQPCASASCDHQHFPLPQ